MPATTAPRALFDEAVALIKAGRLDAAEAACRGALERHPGDVNMEALLGALLFRLHRHDESEAVLRKVIATAPRFAKPAEDLGHLLLHTGRAAEALPFLERATRLDPALEGAWLCLGSALELLGRLHEAELTYRRVLRDNPRNVDALRRLARFAAGAGHADDAESMLKEALRIAPDYGLARLDLGRLLADQDRFTEALECFDRVLALEPGQAQAHLHRAATLARASFTAESIAAYRDCLAIQPAHAGALLGLGHVLNAMGDSEAAAASYLACIEAEPGSGQAYWSLANLKTYRFDDATLADMEKRAAEQGDDRESEANFLFAIAKAWEDRGDYPRAWDSYSRGNRTKRAEVSYDPAQAEAVNDRILASFTPELLASLRDAGDPDPSPIFILGLPRSGSTLLEQVLASHPSVEGTAELPYVGRLAASIGMKRPGSERFPEAMHGLAPPDLAALGTQYLRFARVHRRTGAPRFIDKMPNNFPYVGLIALMLPNAKIIDARRHPLDACLSCWRQLFTKGQDFTYDLAEVGRYYLQYQRMMDHWERVLPGRVLTVQYEEVVADFEAQARRLLAFCDLPWDDACLRFWERERPVRTPSAGQVRQPIYARSVGHWRLYERQLGTLIDALAPIRDRYRRYEGA